MLFCLFSKNLSQAIIDADDAITPPNAPIANFKNLFSILLVNALAVSTPAITDAANAIFVIVAPFLSCFLY